MSRLNVSALLIFVGVMGLCGLVGNAQTLRQTPTPTATALSPTEAPPVTATPAGDAQIGAALFTTFQPEAGIACATCHRVDSDERLIGPGLLTVGERAATRVEDLTAGEYIRQSIIDPSAYLVEGYQDMMTKNFRMVFTDDELDDLVAFLLSLAETNKPL